MDIAMPAPATKISLCPVQPISQDVLAEKYLKSGETDIEQLYQRVAKALAGAEKSELQQEWEQKFLVNLRAGAIGAGRIMSTIGPSFNKFFCCFSLLCLIHYLFHLYNF